MIAALLISLIPMTSSSLDPLALEPAPMAPVTVMSFNIRFPNPADGDHFWDNRRDAAIAMLRDKKPEILGLQEALASQNSDILRAFPHFQMVGVGRDDGQAKGEHCTIFFDRRRFRLLRGGDFWLSDTPTVPGSKSWGNTITRLCTWVRLEDIASRATFYVFNCHLDHQSQYSRERSVALILSRLAEREARSATILMGDFNADEANPAIEAVRKAGYVDTWRVRYPADPEAGTFHGFTGVPRGGKIDYIFVDNNWETTDASIEKQNYLDRVVSDHFPVMATLRLKT